MSDFDERMEQLRQRFRTRGAEDRGRLVIALEQDDRPGLIAIAHGLSGSAGVFGFAEISRAASLVEELAEREDGERLRVAAARLLDLLGALDQDSAD